MMSIEKEVELQFYNAVHHPSSFRVLWKIEDDEEEVMDCAKKKSVLMEERPHSQELETLVGSQML